MTTTAPSTPGTDRETEAEAAVPVTPTPADRPSPSVVLSNRQKVAVVLAQLGPKKATPILKEMLSDPDAIAFTTEVANLPSLDSDTVVGVLGELVARIHESTLVNQGGITLARQFLQERLGQARADEVFDELETKSTVGPLAVLAHADPRQVVAILAEQQPRGGRRPPRPSCSPRAPPASWRSCRASSGSRWRAGSRNSNEWIRRPCARRRR